MAVAALSLWLVSTAALAQATAAPTVDPERLKLAREVMAENGGVDATRAQLKNVFGTVSKMVKSEVSTSPQAAALSDALMQHVMDEEMKAVPQMIEDSAQVYAEHLSVRELTDMLAYSRSETARSVRAKMPAITEEALMRQAPLMKRMIASSVQKAVDLTCEESHCTADQRQALNALVRKMAPTS